MIVGDLDGTILDSRKQISPDMNRMRNQLRQQEILLLPQDQLQVLLHILQS